MAFLNRKNIMAMAMLVGLAFAAHAQEKTDLSTADDLTVKQVVDDAAQLPPVTQPAVASQKPAKPKLPLWEAGVLGMGISHPAYPGADEHTNLLLPLPFMIYRGEFLRVDRGNVGVRAIKTPRTELDIGFAAAPGSRASDVEARRGMDDLGILVEFGPRLKINLGEEGAGRRGSRIQLAARGVFDATDYFKYHGIAFEPQWVKDMLLPGQWFTSFSLGAVYGEQKLADTFYRVTPAEATSSRPAYDAKIGLISLRAGGFASRLLNSDVRFFSYVVLDSVQGAANHDSPLVKRDYGWAAGIGLAWTLARSEGVAND